MNLELRMARHEPESLNTDEAKQTVDASTMSGLNPFGSKETDLATQNSPEMKEHFPSYLRPVSKSTVNDVGTPSLIKINRTESFDPVKFMNHPGLAIEEQDGQSIMIEEIDPSDIFLQSTLAGETVIRGEEHLKRLKKMRCIRLDAKIFQTLWENQHLIPESWKGTTDNPKHIFFDGTVFRNHCGRFTITMYWDKTSWDKDEKWRWTYCRLDIGEWNAHDLSAVLKGY